MGSSVTSLKRILQGADRALMLAATIAASIALVVAVGAGFWQVLSRFLFASPSVWSEALTRMALIWMVLLGISLALRTGSMIAIDILRSVVSGPLKRALEAASLTSALVLFGVLFWMGWEMAIRVRFQEMAGLEISMSWGYAAIPVGSLTAALGAISHFIALGSGERT